MLFVTAKLIVMKTSFDNDITFKSSYIYKNKKLLRMLKYASDNAPVITSGATLVGGAIIRPISILASPNVSEKNKQYASSKTIASSLIGFLLTISIFKPISNVLEKITTNPEKFLKKQTVKNLKENSENLKSSPSFDFLKQLVKFSPEFLAILPKAFIVTSLIVPIMNICFKNKKNGNDNSNNKKNPIHKDITFKGKSNKMETFIINF